MASVAKGKNTCHSCCGDKAELSGSNFCGPANYAGHLLLGKSTCGSAVSGVASGGVAPLAGRKEGFYDENGIRLLVTSSPELVTADARAWGLLEKILRSMISGPSEPWANEQWIVFNGWVKIARQALLGGKFQPGQALAIAGEVESGKSLL